MAYIQNLVVNKTGVVINDAVGCITVVKGGSVTIAADAKVKDLVIKGGRATVHSHVELVGMYGGTLNLRSSIDTLVVQQSAGVANVKFTKEIHISLVQVHAYAKLDVAPLAGAIQINVRSFICHTDSEANLSQRFVIDELRVYRGATFTTPRAGVLGHVATHCTCFGKINATHTKVEKISVHSGADVNIMHTNSVLVDRHDTRLNVYGIKVDCSVPMPLITCSGMGSMGRCVYFYKTAQGCTVKAGCFTGSLNEFRAKVRQDTTYVKKWRTTDSTTLRKAEVKEKQYLGMANIVAMTWGLDIEP